MTSEALHRANEITYMCRGIEDALCIAQKYKKGNRLSFAIDGNYIELSCIAGEAFYDVLATMIISMIIAYLQDRKKELETELNSL